MDATGGEGFVSIQGAPEADHHGDRITHEAHRVKDAGPSSRACRKLVRERAYPVMLLFGGARVPVDCTGLVGEWTAATLNYSAVNEILKADPPLQRTVNDPVGPAILRTSFEDFRRPMTQGALSPEEFDAFGPVPHSRDAFVEGGQAVVAEIRAQRGRWFGDKTRAS